LRPEAPTRFALHLRIPGWCDQWQAAVNGLPQNAPASSGYLHLAREWQPGDSVTLDLEMPVRYIYANPRVRQTVGRAAIQRGPLIYCLEGVDHGGRSLDGIVLPPDSAAWQIEFRADLLGGVSVLLAESHSTADPAWGEALYRYDAPARESIRLTAIPYCVWDNREPGEMRVWLRSA
jgi:DUF1680 family protein